MPRESVHERQRMVAVQVAARGVKDPLVLQAMRQVPREEFIPAAQRPFAYDDGPLPIGAGQTISQPLVVASMIEALRLQGGEKVLEVGTGSGYAAAVVSRIAAMVYGVERIPALVRGAQAVLERLGHKNVLLAEANGTLGWSAHAPYDAILVSAGAPYVPRPLLDQMADGGRLVIPVGSADDQMLMRVTRERAGKTRHEELGLVRFVPLLGVRGWSGKDRP